MALVPSAGGQHRKTLMPSSLMAVVGLDPMAGLDPAVRQVEQARLLAERAIYYAQRMPILIDLQLDRSLNRLAAGPESRKLHAADGEHDRLRGTLCGRRPKHCPRISHSEREALVNQLTDLLDTQQPR